MKSARNKARTKSRVSPKPMTLAEKIPYFIGCNTSDALPADLSVCYKDYLRANLVKNYSG